MPFGPFPPELLHKIVDEVAALQDGHTLRSCNLTSRSLSHQARQHLFKEIVIDGVDPISDLTMFYDHLSPPGAPQKGISRYVKEVCFSLRLPDTSYGIERFYRFLDDPQLAKTLNLLCEQCRLTEFEFIFENRFESVPWSKLSNDLRNALVNIINFSRLSYLVLQGVSCVPIDLFDRSHVTSLSLYSVTLDPEACYVYPESIDQLLPRIRLSKLDTNFSFNIMQAYGGSPWGHRQRPTCLISISQLQSLIMTFDSDSDYADAHKLLEANDGTLEYLELDTAWLDLEPVGAIDFEHLCNLKSLMIYPPIPPGSDDPLFMISFQIHQILHLLHGPSPNVSLECFKAEFELPEPPPADLFSRLSYNVWGTLEDELLGSRFSNLRKLGLSFTILHDHNTSDLAAFRSFLPTWLPCIFPRLSKSKSVAVTLTAV